MGDFDQSAGTSDRETKRIDPIHKKRKKLSACKESIPDEYFIALNVSCVFFIYCDEF